MLLRVFILSCVLALVPHPASAMNGLFGTLEFRARSLDALPQWQRVLDEIADQRPDYKACTDQSAACPSDVMKAWRGFISLLQNASPMEQVRAVNRFVNRWEYKEDDVNYGASDVWVSPMQFFQTSGDCEDFAIVKYVSLRDLGFPPESLRIVVVRDTLRQIAHAVLAVHVDGQVYIMDNVTGAVLPQERVLQYKPYYSVNESHRWAHVEPTQQVIQTLRLASASRSSDGKDN